MDVPITAEVLIGLLAGLVFAMIVLLVLQVRNSVAVNRLAAPAYEYVRSEAERQSKDIVEQAKRRAAEITSAAEQERTETLAVYQEHAESLQHNYEAQLAAHTDALQQKISDGVEQQVAAWKKEQADLVSQAKTAQSDIAARMKELQEQLHTQQTRIEQDTTASLSELQTTITAAGDQLTEKLATYDTQLSKQIDTHTAKALEAIDAELRSYKKAREHIVDTNITRVVEAVVKRVLHKQLTVSEHAELVQTALAEAKREGNL